MSANELADEIKEVLQEQEGLPWGTNQCLLYKAQIMLRTIPALEAEVKNHRQVIYWLMENRPDIWQTILEVRILESMSRKEETK